MWLANHPAMQGVWSSAGRMYSVDPEVYWEEDEQPGQQLVIIGHHLDVAKVTGLLDACLATEEELAAPNWLDQDDPYEDFSAQGDDEEHEEHEAAEAMPKKARTAE